MSYVQAADDGGDSRAKEAARKQPAPTPTHANENHITTKRPITPDEIVETLYTQGLPKGVKISVIETNPGDRAIQVKMKRWQQNNLAALSLTIKKIQSIVEGDMEKDEKLAILAGEEHKTSAHHMLGAALVAMNKGALLGLEHPVNDLAAYVHHSATYNMPMSPLGLDKLPKADPKGHLYARALINKNYYPAPLSHNYVLNAVLRAGGSVVLTDAMRKNNDNYIDFNDELAAKYRDQFYPDCEGEAFPSHSDVNRDVRGMNIRNGVMAHRTLAELFKKHSSFMVAILAIGLTHLHGNKAKGLGYEHSQIDELHRQAPKNDQNLRSLSIFSEKPRPDITAEKVIPPGSHPKNISIIVKGYNEERPYDWSFTEEEWVYNADKEREIVSKLAKSFKKEAKWYSRLLRNIKDPTVKAQAKAQIAAVNESFTNQIKPNDADIRGELRETLQI